MLLTSSIAFFAGLPLPADDVTHEAMFSRRRCVRGLHRLALENAEGAGKAGCPLHPWTPRKKKCAERVNHRYRRIHSGLPCANGLRLIRTLPGEPTFATVTLREACQLR